MGGVLFIDEAYSLASTDDADVRDFGHRVLDTLMPILSEPDKDIVVVMAGYGEEMEKMLNSNRGLRSRFPIRYVFEDYTVDELMQMAQNYFDEFNYQLTLPAVERLREAFKEAKQHKSFGNGRFVSTLIENFILPAMASRVRDSIDNCLNRSDLCILSTITAEDIPDVNAVKQMFDTKERKRIIGFA